MLRDKEFVILDVETTGLSPRHGDRVIEIAALRIRGLEVIDQFESLIDPQREVSYGAFLVNRISNDMLEGAPLAGEVIPEFLRFIEGTCLIGHNIKFDLKFLNNEFSICDLSQLDNIEAIDTVKMARGLMPELKRFSLPIMSYQLGIDHNDQHRAMGDTRATLELFQQLLELARKKNIDQYDTLLNLFGLNRISKQHKHEKLRLIEDAITDERRLHLLYFGSNSGTTSRQVTPKKIMGTGREATLIGFCHLRQQERNFIVDRIVNCEKQAHDH